MPAPARPATCCSPPWDTPAATAIRSSWKCANGDREGRILGCPRLPDDVPDIWHEQWLGQQTPELRKQYAASDALAAELAAERPAFVGLSDAPLFPSQRFDAPRAPAAQPSRGEEVDLVERARLNVVDQFYRGTLNGAIALRALAARANGPDDPEPDTVARAEQGLLGSAVPGRDQARSEYRAIVADLQKYDRIRPSASWLEYGASGVGQIAGGIPTPESLAGLPGRGATLLGRMAIAGAKTAGLNVATDAGVQQLSIGSKVQEKYDWVRTAAAAPIGFVIGAGLGALGSAGVRSAGGAAGAAEMAPASKTASGRSLDDLLADAKRMQVEIERTGRAIAAETNTQFFTSGPKTADSAQNTFVQRRYSDYRQLVDLARISIIVKTPQQGDAVANALARSFEIDDRGFRTYQYGYFDRKVFVQDEKGIVGEVQIIPEAIFRAKQSGGHELYKQAGALPKGPEKYLLNTWQEDLYSAARDELGEEWGEFLSRTGRQK